jgi:hypothetical protein
LYFVILLEYFLWSKYVKYTDRDNDIDLPFWNFSGEKNEDFRGKKKERRKLKIFNDEAQAAP